MPMMMNRALGRLLIAALLALIAAAAARADVLILTDGRTLIGEVVEETRRMVKFRCQVNNLWTTLTIDRGDVYSLDKEEGDQSDLSGQAGEKEGRTGTVTPPPTRRSDPRPEPRRPSRRGEAVVVIPLHGQVGGAVDGVVGRLLGLLLDLLLDLPSSECALSCDFVGRLCRLLLLLFFILPACRLPVLGLGFFKGLLFSSDFFGFFRPFPDFYGFFPATPEKSGQTTFSMSRTCSNFASHFRIVAGG